MPNLTTSSLYRQGTSAQTSSVISSRFKIYTPAVGQSKFTKLGVTSSFQQSESKNIEAIRGLGYGDNVAELVPGVTEPLRLTVNRTMLYLANVMQMLGYKGGVSGAVRSIKHHKWPFDIMTEVLFSQIASTDPGINQADVASIPAEGGTNNTGDAPLLYCVQTLFLGCWMNDYSVNYQIDTAAVAEDATITVTDVIDNNGSQYGEFIDAGNSLTDTTGGSLIFGENNINK